MDHRMTWAERKQVVGGMSFIRHIAIREGWVIQYFSVRLTLSKLWFAIRILLRGV